MPPKNKASPNTAAGPSAKRSKESEPEEQPEPVHYGSKLGKLWNPRFSDITVMLTGHPEKYKLHRVIICSESELFKTKCEEADVIHSSEPTLQVNFIESSIFETVLKWMYTTTYHLPAAFDKSTLVKTYTAASLLGLKSLKVEMMQQISITARGIIKNRKDIGPTEVWYELIGDLAGISKPEDFDILQQPLQHIITVRKATPSSLREEANLDRNKNNFFDGLIIDSLQKMFHDKLCRDCRISWNDTQDGKCQGRGCKNKLPACKN